MRAVLFLLLAACGGADVHPVAFDDKGTLCLLARESTPTGPQQFRAGSAIHVSFALEDVCLSSSCTTDRSFTCAVTGGPTSFAITTHAGWLEVRDPDVACTDDCLIPYGTCTTGSLPAGSYAFTYGAQTLTVDVPSDVAEPPCATN